jgi:hypothetical protein
MLNGSTSMKHTTIEALRTRRSRRDASHDAHRCDVARALKFALCSESNGMFAALAWASAGCPPVFGHHDIERLQVARLIVQANGCKLKPGDVDRALELLRERREARSR